MPIKDEIEKIVNRLSNMGYHEVEPENPYWIERNHNRGSDGWRIVLMNASE